MKKMLLGLSGVLVFTLLLPGCPAENKDELFNDPLVVKIDLKKDGICKRPLVVAVVTNYQTSVDIGLEEESLLETTGIAYGCKAINEIDCYYLSGNCELYISHDNQFSDGLGITNFSPSSIPLSVHIKNLCTLEEYHLEGELPTFDITPIHACRVMMDGWKSDERHYVEECLNEIPFTTSATYTPETDFDWSQFYAWSKYHDYYNCEDFR